MKISQVLLTSTSPSGREFWYIISDWLTVTYWNWQITWLIVLDWLYVGNMKMMCWFFLLLLLLFIKFLACGNLSIYTEIHPSKKMVGILWFYTLFWPGISFSFSITCLILLDFSFSQVTVCLAMYVISLLGIIISAGFRVYCLTFYSYLNYRTRYSPDPEWAINRMVSCSKYF